MGLNNDHFNVVMEHLGKTMQELNVSPELISEAGAIAESARNDVLGK
jgi:hemoglobin